MTGFLLALAVAPLTVLHLDFNSIRLERREIESTLEFAAKAGYDSVLWEVEDKIRWETCPECVHPEAFTKDEFRGILAKAKSLGLKPIPLLQTFGHAEYVLECERYRPWRELASAEDCYCVSKPEVREFLKRWIHEYLDLFGDEVADFHLGGDEARCFGSCRTCSKRNRMELYAEHLKEISGELRARGIRPGIWCDMILSGTDRTELARIPRDFTIWHWDYGYTGDNAGEFAAWAGKTKVLTELGFDVIFAASSSCYGDGPFLPDINLHMSNAVAAANLVRREGLRGLCMTSWSVRQGLKSLQRPIWSCAVTGRLPEPSALGDLTAWDPALTVYDGRDWHKWMKDGKIAPTGEIDRILERLHEEDPDFAARHLEKVASLERRISSARKNLEKDSPLAEGADLSLEFLSKIRAVLTGAEVGSVPIERTARYFAREQTSRSAKHSAELVWSVLAGEGNGHRNLLASHPPVKDLPELLTCADGSAVDSVCVWEKKRRREILDVFSREVYGVRPVERPEVLEFDRTAPDKVMMDGKAVRKLVTVRYAGPRGEGVFRIVAFVPRRPTPAPAFVLICNRSFELNVDPERKRRTAFWPAEEIVARGYAAVAFHNAELSSDDAREEYEDGVHAVFGPDRRTEESWGSLSAWAWGASRVMDWIETEPVFDTERVAVVGHSRGGKTSLWAGATDTRFALTCVNDSGCGGARLNRVELPLAETFSLIDIVNPHWFCRNHRKWMYRDLELPFDQHELLALIAPRLLAVGSASLDAGAGPYGEYLSCRYASPAWTLYGLKGLTPDTFPRPGETCSDGCLSYHLRRGGHDLNLEDWAVYMDFAERHGWK